MFKRLLKFLKLGSHEQQVNTIERRTFTENGDFIKAEDFELLWIATHVNYQYNATNCLDDDDYIDYNLWEDMNVESLYKKHFPKGILFRGKNPNIIFHAGCLGCLSQRLNGFDRCKGCQYFRVDWNKPNLHIEGEDSAKMSGDDFKRLLGGE